MAFDFNAIIALVVPLIADIYKRHSDAGQTVTAEQVAEELLTEISEGKHKILSWYLSKGRPAPL